MAGHERVDADASGEETLGEPPLDRSLSPTACLAPSWFVDADDPTVRDTARRVAGTGEDVARAVRLFDFVRDDIRYEFRAKFTREEYRASRVLADRRGFCVQKAVLLCALLRAERIAAALVLCDLRDDTLPPRVVEAMGTETMFHHGLDAIHLGGRWRLADASLSPDVVARKRYRRVDFDGSADSLFPSTTLDGSPHAAVVRFHGLYVDLPFEQMLSAFMTAYAKADLNALAKLGNQL